MEFGEDSGGTPLEVLAIERLRERARECFPALAQPLVFLENAGGSQVPAMVAERVRDYFRNTYVQLGAGYPLSDACGAVVAAAHSFVLDLFHAGDPEPAAPGEAERGIGVLGSSSSALVRTLAEAVQSVWKPGQEIVIAENGHEANIGPWLRLGTGCGAQIRWWRVDPSMGDCTLDSLDAVLSENTGLVVFPHVSNLLGEICDVAEVTRRAHRVGARVVVDGVAFAPHRALAVGAWDVDWYVFSTYKTYGPHLGALFGKRQAFAGLRGPNHFFIAEEDLPYKFEVGGVSHEGCAALIGTQDYYAYLARAAWMPGAPAAGQPAIPAHRAADVAGTSARRMLEDTPSCADLARVGACLRDLELPLQARLLRYLRERPDVRIFGPHDDGETRVGTISFRLEGLSAAEATRRIQARGFAIRHGHMYSYRLCKTLGIEPEDGVVRVSLVHYNTPQEMERLIETLDHVRG